MRPATQRGLRAFGIGLLVMSLPFVGGATAASNDQFFPKCVVPATAAKAAWPRTIPFPVQHDDRTNATFFFSLATDGAVVITATAGELRVEKMVYRDGRSRLVLQAGDDRVTVSVAPGEVAVERDGKRLALDVGRAADEEWLRVKVALAGSKALRLFRNLAANLGERFQRTPAGGAVALSDAVVGQLGGDAGAMHRLIEKARAAVTARTRPVHFEEESPDCWHQYELDVMHAADDYDSCRKLFYWYDPRQAGCAFVWGVQAEVAWGQLLACASISPLKMKESEA